jgi:hypothetical protein
LIVCRHAALWERDPDQRGGTERKMDPDSQYFAQDSAPAEEASETEALPSQEANSHQEAGSGRMKILQGE